MLLEDEENVNYETFDNEEVSKADSVPQRIPSALVLSYVS